MTRITEAEYRAMPGLSGTQIATILDSPMRFKWELEHPSKSTPAQAFGTIVHALVLNQPLPCVVSDYADFRTKEAQEWKAAREADGLIVVKESELDEAMQACAAVMANDTARRLLEAPGESEVVVTGEHRGQPLKGRIDRLPETGPLVDFKTTKDASAHGMQRSMADYGYATQLAHYSALTGRTDAPLIIAVENIAPYRVVTYRIDALTWDLAGRATALAWDVFADCMETDTWPSGLPDDITDIGLRPWAYDELEMRVNPDAFAEMEIR